MKQKSKNIEYNHLKVEKKWQSIWKKKKVNITSENGNKPKCYVLDMFPYPSGEGLHVGHPRGYIATDIYSRLKRMKGFNVLHPMGWDAFGLPAEQYAIKMKINPEIAVRKNVKRYKEQVSMIGLNYDWNREINTTDPKYYKWTQWIFLQLFKKGLAYESFEPINWCPSCKTGLANEDVEDSKCERCETIVEKKPMRQWVLKIRNYADRLIDDLDELNWPEHIKQLQKNWIGRSEGAKLWFNIANSDEKIYVFTTRPDTLYGVTYVVLAPENKLIEKLKPQIKNWKEVEDYIKSSKNKSEIERTSESKEKTGVILEGVVVKHPITKEIIPAYISDYVLGHYGTGAVMAVPAHDERDFVFAKKYNLRIKEVISGGNISDGAYTGDGLMINSGIFDGMNNNQAKKEITDIAGGEMTKNYKLQNWVFSRQRYWGEPIPLVHCEKCGIVAVPEKELPLKLPKVKSYEPTGTGESPLAAISKWVNTKCPNCKGKAKRETNTMPQWAGSSWYYLRYMDPKNNKALVDKKKEKYWAPVDMYVGGAEHATRHLIYARFWHKFLFDIGVVSTNEPFKQYKNPGMILGSDNRKMSKRWGNVINPDEVIKNVGADTLRVYESFMGPFEQEIAWSTDSMVGSKRFLERVWKLQEKVSDKFIDTDDVILLLNQTIKKVEGDIESFNANTAISSMMILSKLLENKEKISKKTYLEFIKILSPFAPHICEEIWNVQGNKKLVALESWPKYDESKLTSSSVKIIVQVNGKVRGTIEVPIDSNEDTVKREALKNELIVKWVGGTKIVKQVFIKNRIINFVV
jgi:leucyl-tRNA synthetase